MNYEIKLFDADFKPIGILDEYESLIVHKKCFDTGSFELHTPIWMQGISHLYNAALHAFGIIDRVSTADGVYAGRLLKGCLSDAVITEQETLIDVTPEYAAYYIAQKYAPMPMTFAQSKGLGTPVTIDIEWGERVDEYLNKLLATQELYYDITYDFKSKALVFAVHGITEPENALPLSYEYQTIHEYQYAYDRSDYRNYAYVKGSYAEADILLEVDARAESSEQKREVAFDLSGDVEQEGLSEEQYRASLKQRALEKLSEYAAEETLTFTPAVEIALGERRLFVDDNRQLAATQAVTETAEAIEDGCVKKTYVFGLQQLTDYKKAVRDARR